LCRRLLRFCAALCAAAACRHISEWSGLKRKLDVYLAPESDLLRSPWDIGECIGSWTRPNLDTVFYPYSPPHITRPKEIKKLFIVQLPEHAYFGVGGWAGIGPLGPVGALGALGACGRFALLLHLLCCCSATASCPATAATAGCCLCHSL
jgi:hypothetical protein